MLLYLGGGQLSNTTTRLLDLSKLILNYPIYMSDFFLFFEYIIMPSRLLTDIFLKNEIQRCMKRHRKNSK